MLEKRLVRIHPQGPGAWIEFHATEDCVECRIFSANGAVDRSADNCHALLILYNENAKITLYLSSERVRDGIVRFPKEAADGNWSEPVPRGMYRLNILDDEGVRAWKQRLQRNYPSLSQLRWVAKQPWSGQAIFNE